MHELTFWQIMWIHFVDGAVPTIVAAGAWWAIASHRRDMKNGRFHNRIREAVEEALKSKIKDGDR